MPRTSHRSSVRGFRRSSAASCSLVKNSERMDSEPDIAISYATNCAQRDHIYENPSREQLGDLGDGISPPFLVEWAAPLTPQGLLNVPNHAFIEAWVSALVFGLV